MIKQRVDIVHTHCSKAGFLGRTAARLIGVKIILHSAHCFAFLRTTGSARKFFYLFCEKLLSRITTSFIAVSRSERAIAIEKRIFPTDKCIVINNALKYKSAAPTANTLSKRNLAIPKDYKIIALAARLVDYKGIFIFLDSARLSRQKCVFLLAGQGPLRDKIEKYIAEHHLAEKVRLLGYVEDMNGLYHISDIMVCCSHMEAQPYTLLEAMRAKVPIIATNVPGNTELLVNDRGILVDPDVGRITRAIDHLAENSSEQKALAQNAYQYFCENHNLSNQINRLMSFYQNAYLETKTNSVVNHDCRDLRTNV